MDPGLERGGVAQKSFRMRFAVGSVTLQSWGGVLSGRRKQGGAVKRVGAVPAMLGTIIVYAGDVETVLLLGKC
jgi:hypothetical protein